MTMFDPEISKGTRLVQVAGGFVVMAAFIGFIIYLAFGWNNAAKDARDAQGDYHTQVIKTETLQSEYNKLYSEFQNATGKKPAAASPQSISGATGPRGEMGVQGQTGPSGPSGAAGADGKNGVNGSDGKNGVNGEAGATGDKGDAGEAGAPGAAGPAGPAGPPGADGTDGSPGRGLQSMSCDGDGVGSSWLITYTDGTAATVPGPCRLSILP